VTTIRKNEMNLVGRRMGGYGIVVAASYSLSRSTSIEKD
jgi:hypothetical protein